MAAQHNNNNLQDNNPNSIQIPLLENLNDEGVEVFRQLGGFPNNWNRVMISMWLGDYDKIILERYQLNNGFWTIRSNNAGHFQNINYNNVTVPLTAFTTGCVESIHRMLLNMDVEDNEWDNWLRYLNDGGNDRVRIAVRRYNPNLHDFLNNNPADGILDNLQGLDLNIFGEALQNNQH